MTEHKFKYVIVVEDAPEHPPWNTDSEVSATARLTHLLTLYPWMRVGETCHGDGRWEFRLRVKKEG